MLFLAARGDDGWLPRLFLRGRSLLLGCWLVTTVRPLMQLDPQKPGVRGPNSRFRSEQFRKVGMLVHLQSTYRSHYGAFQPQKGEF